MIYYDNIIILLYYKGLGVVTYDIKETEKKDVEGDFQNHKVLDIDKQSGSASFENWIETSGFWKSLSSFKQGEKL